MPGPIAAAGAPRAAAFAWSNRRWLLWLLALLLALPVLLAALFAGMAGMQSSSPVGSFKPSALALRDIPSGYLRIYQAAGANVGWEYLAAIGKVETDHGRSTAPGVRSGVNAFGCCAGPMQFSVVGRPSTWDSYGVDGNNDGRTSPFDPRDAIPAAAAYLEASGAPGDWDAALFAYNHAIWYVNEVKHWADRYRGDPIGLGGLPAGSGISQALLGRWLAPVPGTAAVCDSRIVPDVAALLRRYRLAAGDCFSLTGHAYDGEHPLGLALDVTPGPGGSWDLVAQMARDLGWNAGCGATGCAGLLPSPFRFIGYNGYPGHGDPAHAGGNAHLHLSWQHTPAAPGSPAARVQTLLPPSGEKRP
ncbi:MAG: hypothetical protein QOD24_2831 [Solirubrobacteraceae bacterium]|nr:hypothetical protein [Solirubrobacteraceae bacterium]